MQRRLDMNNPPPRTKLAVEDAHSITMEVIQSIISNPNLDSREIMEELKQINKSLRLWLNLDRLDVLDYPDSIQGWQIEISGIFDCYIRTHNVLITG